MFKVGDLVTITANEPYGTTTMTKGNVEVVRSVVKVEAIHDYEYTLSDDFIYIGSELRLATVDEIRERLKTFLEKK